MSWGAHKLSCLRNQERENKEMFRLFVKTITIYFSFRVECKNGTDRDLALVLVESNHISERARVREGFVVPRTPYDEPAPIAFRASLLLPGRVPVIALFEC